MATKTNPVPAVSELQSSVIEGADAPVPGTQGPELQNIHVRFLKTYADTSNVYKEGEICDIPMDFFERLKTAKAVEKCI